MASVRLVQQNSKLALHFMRREHTEIAFLNTTRSILTVLCGHPIESQTRQGTQDVDFVTCSACVEKLIAEGHTVRGEQRREMF